MNVPAVTFLEMSRPFNRVASQALVFFQPVASVALTGEDYNRFAQFLEKSGSVDYLCRRIEELAAEAAAPSTLASCESSAVASEASAASPRE
jgi:hypothetical protein